MIVFLKKNVVVIISGILGADLIKKHVSRLAPLPCETLQRYGLGLNEIAQKPVFFVVEELIVKVIQTFFFKTLSLDPLTSFCGKSLYVNISNTKISKQG